MGLKIQLKKKKKSVLHPLQVSSGLLHNRFTSHTPSTTVSLPAPFPLEFQTHWMSWLSVLAELLVYVVASLYPSSMLIQNLFLRRQLTIS